MKSLHSHTQKNIRCQHKNNQFTQQSLNVQAKRSRKTVTTTDTQSPDPGPDAVPNTAHTSSFYAPNPPCLKGPPGKNTSHTKEGTEATAEPALQPILSDPG